MYRLDFGTIAQRLLDRLLQDYCYKMAPVWEKEGRMYYYSSYEELLRRREDAIAVYKECLAVDIGCFMSALALTISENRCGGTLFVFTVLEDVAVKSNRSGGVMSYTRSYARSYKLHHTVANCEVGNLTLPAYYSCFLDGLVYCLVEFWELLKKECIGSLVAVDSARCLRFSAWDRLDENCVPI